VRTDALALRRMGQTAQLSFSQAWADTHPRTLYLLREEADTWARSAPLALELPAQAVI
jgi:exopolyphosphatase / guanosine-5'-triphosphate,3'-diphosphate pyrophosphatase